MATRRGRPSKGPRDRINSMVPTPVHQLFTEMSDETGASLGDLGAYFTLVGLNQHRRERGLPEFALPSHLRDLEQTLHAPLTQDELHLGVAS